jgi:hypothetical protein
MMALSRRPLAWSGKLCGGIMADIRRRGPYYKSDWVDAFLPANQGKTLSTTCFIFFACLSAALSFGALFGEFTDQQLGASETILASSVTGIAYSLFGGQPLAIMGATGNAQTFAEQIEQKQKENFTTKTFVAFG